MITFQANPANGKILNVYYTKDESTIKLPFVVVKPANKGDMIRLLTVSSSFSMPEQSFTKIETLKTFLDSCVHYLICRRIIKI